MLPFIKFLSLSFLLVVIAAVVIAGWLIASSLFCVFQDEVNQIVTSNVRLRQVKWTVRELLYEFSVKKDTSTN